MRVVMSSHAQKTAKPVLQRQAGGVTQARQPLSLVNEVVRSPGEPLAVKTRQYFEPRLGHDFSRVRIHTDARAAESAETINALAYTLGPHIVVPAQHYDVDSDKGRRLMAHELVHVMQQGHTQPASSDFEISTPGDRFEIEADHIADRLGREVTNAVQTSAVQRPLLQRIPAAGTCPT